MALYGIRRGLLPGEWRAVQRRLRNICEDCGQDAFTPNDGEGAARSAAERLLCEPCDRDDLQATAGVEASRA